MSGYYPTYRLPIDGDMDGDTASWLLDQNGEGPLELSDVTDMCATYHVSAELRDEAGFLRGRVDENGDYRLGGP